MIARGLRALARAGALAAGGVAAAVALMVVASVASRAMGGRPIPGDVELTQFGVALALSLCLPWCQLNRANIIVDFFTQRASRAAQRRMDAAGAVLLAAMSALLAWRTAVGAQAVFESGESSMILELPMGLAYLMLAPGLALSAAVALWQATRLLQGRDPEPEA